jgi:hypothetical protein
MVHAEKKDTSMPMGLTTGPDFSSGKGQDQSSKSQNVTHLGGMGTLNLTGQIR